MENPTMLYRCPGDEVFEGVACETTVVEEAEVESMHAEGWRRDWMKAKDAHGEALAQLKANEEEQAEIERKLAAGRRELKAVHKGRGKYDLVNAAGEVVKTGLTKDEALAAAGG